MRHTTKLIFAMTLFLIPAAAACGGDDGGGGGELPCSPSRDCPSGQFCFNGICALGCNSGGDCAEGQYCDTDGDRLCHDSQVHTCPDTPCAETQECVNGLCSTPSTDTDCTPRPDGNDGCDAYSLCIEVEEGAPSCYSFPACPESGDCPVGTVGAVCNDGIVPNKERICLSGLCQEPSHCPPAWSCMRITPADVVGFCFPG
jgi:hypothetical protein